MTHTFVGEEVRALADAGLTLRHDISKSSGSNARHSCDALYRPEGRDGTELLDAPCSYRSDVDDLLQFVRGRYVEVDARRRFRNRRRCRTPRGWRLGSFTAFHLHRVATRAVDFEHDRALLVRAIDPASLVGIKPQRVGLRVTVLIVSSRTDHHDVG